MSEPPAADNLRVTLIVSVRVRSGAEAAFEEWQLRWQRAVLAANGALSCDLWPAAPPDQDDCRGGHSLRIRRRAARVARVRRSQRVDRRSFAARRRRRRDAARRRSRRSLLRRARRDGTHRHSRRSGERGGLSAVVRSHRKSASGGAGFCRSVRAPAARRRRRLDDRLAFRHSRASQRLAHVAGPSRIARRIRST